MNRTQCPCPLQKAVLVFPGQVILRNNALYNTLRTLVSLRDSTSRVIPPQLWTHGSTFDLRSLSVFLSIAPPEAAPAFDPGRAARPLRASTWSPHTQLGVSCGSSKRRAGKKEFRCFKWEEIQINFTNLDMNLKKTLKNKPTYERPKRRD